MRHPPSRPDPTIRGRSCQGLTPLLLLGRIQQRRLPRIGVAPVPETRGTVLPIPPGHLPDPVRRIPGALRDRGRGLPTGQQPHDLPLAARYRIVRPPVALFQLINGPVRGNLSSSHPPRLHPDSVLVGYDSDSITKLNVYQAQLEFGILLESLYPGCNVGFFNYDPLPEGFDKGGLDEWRQSGNTIQQLIDTAVQPGCNHQD